MDRCAECGFEYRLEEAESAGAAIVTEAGGLADSIQVPDSATRRSPDVWSPLEYGCHVRDVLLVQRERVLLARRTLRPSLAPMGRDERAEHDGYAVQDVSDVARQLRDAASLFERVLGRLGTEDWERTVMYNYPGLEERSLRWVAVHTLHEVVHHRQDVERQVTTGG